MKSKKRWKLAAHVAVAARGSPREDARKALSMDNSRKRSIQKTAQHHGAGYLDPEIAPREAAPFFSSMLCCLVLVPFGVLGPLFFVTKGPLLGMNRSRLMGVLVAAVFVFVTILTTAANASMDRIKDEARSKVAGYALRLALRKKRVLAPESAARSLFDARDHHAKMAESALRRRPDAGAAGKGRALTEKQRKRVQDAADAALADDLIAARRRHEKVSDAAQRALAETAASLRAESISPAKSKKGGLAGLRLRVKEKVGGDASPREAAAKDEYEKVLNQSDGDASLVFWRPDPRQPTRGDGVRRGNRGDRVRGDARSRRPGSVRGGDGRGTASGARGAGAWTSRPSRPWSETRGGSTRPTSKRSGCKSGRSRTPSRPVRPRRRKR